jgi:hypothetical protein
MRGTPQFPFERDALRHPVVRQPGPRRFPQSLLLRRTPEIVVRENAQCGEVKLACQLPDNLRPNAAQMVPRRVIGQDHAKEDRPLATPVLADFIADTHHIRPDDLLHAMDRRVNFRLFRDRSGSIISTPAYRSARVSYKSRSCRRSDDSGGPSDEFRPGPP